MVVFSDITTNQIAVESIELLSRAVEQTADGIVITDLSGVIQYHPVPKSGFRDNDRLYARRGFGKNTPNSQIGDSMKQSSTGTLDADSAGQCVSRHSGQPQEER